MNEETWSPDEVAGLLRDHDALFAGLRRLDKRELGMVLGMILHLVDDYGDTPLPNLLHMLADQVSELLEAE